MRDSVKTTVYRVMKVLGAVMAFVMSLTAVFALPSGPSSVTLGTSGRYTEAGGQAVAALAGNVTEVNFNATSTTQSWQGYYGNVSGKFVLGNTLNQSLYDWSLVSPAGEIYATRTSSTPSWTNIHCANLTDIAAEETALGINQATDTDSVNRTFFNSTAFSTFYVGSVPVNQTLHDCFATNLYNNSGAQANYFSEVLLNDNSSAMIYTALISRATGFDNRSHDFQMIVGENGHSGDTSTTTYYFYVELG